MTISHDTFKTSVTKIEIEIENHIHIQCLRLCQKVVGPHAMNLKS